MKQSQITYWCHEVIRTQAPENGIYTDATMGNGNDTLLLCKMAGKAGKVYAFDIQEEALKKTKELLRTHQLSGCAHLILDSHEFLVLYGMEAILSVWMVRRQKKQSLIEQMWAME